MALIKGVHAHRRGRLSYHISDRAMTAKEFENIFIKTYTPLGMYALRIVGDVGFCDPAWGYSNVSTGAGVVAARSKSSATIILTDFLQKELDKVKLPAE